MNFNSPFDSLDHQFTRGSTPLPECYPVANVYYAAGFDDLDARRWFAMGVNPHDAARFRDMGMSHGEAGSWGLAPALVERFRAFRFSKKEAQNWSAAGIWPDHAVHWRRAGFAPESAREIIDRSANPSVALAWTLLSTAWSFDAIPTDDIDPRTLLTRAWLRLEKGSATASQYAGTTTLSRGTRPSEDSGALQLYPGADHPAVLGGLWAT